ncbi:hypothetical protein GJ496_010172 [Pomphorhynchus laevis]|nr:hypothetical protein GJ496_011183 [Pomphorhynchus laevis]KAI0981399.1 hypothetical protein GJ496_010172 [Pomphorhynchus laevis]
MPKNSSGRCCSCNGFDAVCKACVCARSGKACISCWAQNCSNKPIPSSSANAAELCTSSIVLTNDKSHNAIEIENSPNSSFLHDSVQLEMKCTYKACSNYSVISVPRRLSREYLSQYFHCGFCSAKSSLQSDDKELDQLRAVVTSLRKEIPSLNKRVGDALGTGAASSQNYSIPSSSVSNISVWNDKGR